MQRKQIDYLKNVTQQLEDEGLLGKVILNQWQLIVELVTKADSLLLDKSQLLDNTKEKVGKVTPANFRKRISMLNKKFEANNLGIELNNTKHNIAVIIDEQKLNGNPSQQTAEFIQKSNKHNEVNDDKLIAPQASKQPNICKRQVLFSYSWEPNEDELNAQRQFAEMLEQGLKFPPAKYKDSPQVCLFIDYKNFELGEDQSDQQNKMCQETPIAVICYTHKYINSPACQKEANYYLTQEGKNLPNRRAIIVPFDCGYGEMDSRFQKNLALTPPAEFTNGLDFFISASPSKRKAFIGQLVDNIYDWFDKNPNPPKLHKHFEVETTLQASVDSVAFPKKSEPLKGNTQQHHYEGAVNIVECMFDWATGITGKETRLFYLLGDFGAGKSTSCQMLTQKLMANYQQQRQQYPNSKPVMPIYLDLKKLLNAFNDQRTIITQAIPTLLEAMLDSSGVKNNVSGQSIIDFVHEYPCLLIFDGFDEVGQKLTTQQQTGLLNKLIDIFPKSLYQQDLERLQTLAETEATQNSPSYIAPTGTGTTPINSRILLSCRTHFFKTQTQQEAFHQLYYRHEAGVSSGEVKNFQTYYLLPFTKEQIENYLTNWLGHNNAKKALSFIDNVHDLSGLSQRPLMLNLIRDLLPQLQEAFKHNPHINASTLYKLLFDKVGYRDNEKHIIPLDEKRKLLGSFALYLWQQGVTTLHVEALDRWLLEHRQDYPQLNIKLTSVQYEPEIILQDLHNASLLIRDSEDEYRFAHTSFFEFFVAVGIFDSVIHCDDTTQGFDYLFSQAQDKNNLSVEIMQFLLDWRVASRQADQDQFDTHWQQLQQAGSSVTARQMAFDIWYFAYSQQQPFTQMSKPNWQGLTLSKLTLDKQTQATILELSGANLAKATIEECDFSYVDLTGSDFSETHLRQNNFASCDFKSVTCEQAKFYDNRFNHCHFMHAIEKSKNLNVWHANLILPAVSESIQAGCSKQQLLCETVSSDAVAFHPFKPLYLLAGSNGATLWEMTATGVICTQRFKKERQIQSCQFSPDGKEILLGGLSGASLWEITETGLVCIQRFEEERLIRSCQFSADGKQFLLAGRSGANIWEAKETGVICTHRLVEENFIESGQFSPDGKQVLFAGDNGASLWEITETGFCCIQRFAEEKDIRSGQFSPDGKKVILGGIFGASLWEITETEVICVQRFVKVRHIQYCQFSPDGQQVLLAGLDGVSLWEVTKTGFVCIQRLAEEKPIFSCQFSADGQHFLLGRSLGANLYDKSNTGFVCTRRFEGIRLIKSSQFSADGKQVILAGLDGASLWEMTETGFCCTQRLEEERYIQSCRFSADGKQVLLAGMLGTSLWQMTETGFICTQRLAEERYSQSCQFSANGKQVLLAGDNGASLWEMTETGVICLQRLEEERDIRSGRFSADGKQVLLAGRSGASLWEVTETGFVCTQNFEGERYIYSCQFSPDGQQVLLAGRSGASLWKVTDTGVNCTRLFEEERYIQSCQFSADGKQILLGGVDGVSVWTINDNKPKCIQRFAKDKGVFNVSWHQETNTVSVAVLDEIHVYQLDDNKATLISILHQFEQATISYQDIEKTQVTDIQGEAWKYFYNKVTYDDGSIQIFPPDTHPDWQMACQNLLLFSARD